MCFPIHLSLSLSVSFACTPTQHRARVYKLNTKRESARFGVLGKSSTQAARRQRFGFILTTARDSPNTGHQDDALAAESKLGGTKYIYTIQRSIAQYIHLQDIYTLYSTYGETAYSNMIASLPHFTLHVPLVLYIYIHICTRWPPPTGASQVLQCIPLRCAQQQISHQVSSIPHVFSFVTTHLIQKKTIKELRE